MKAVRFTSPDVDSVVMEQLPLPTLREKEILIKVAFTAVNRADTLQVCFCIHSQKGIEV